MPETGSNIPTKEIMHKRAAAKLGFQPFLTKRIIHPLIKT